MASDRYMDYILSFLKALKPGWRWHLNFLIHTTSHLFSCSVKPTSLTTRSSWNQPVDTAEFLGILSFGGAEGIDLVIGLQQQQH